MVNAKSRDHETYGYEEEKKIFKCFWTYVGMAAILVMWP